jgi:antitoxin ParD1/3/4
MPTLTITLSESQKVFVNAHVKAVGLTSAGEYIRSLIQMEQLKKHRHKIDALLLEALNDGPGTPMTAQDWKDIRREVFGDQTRPKRKSPRKQKQK